MSCCAPIDKTYKHDSLVNLFYIDSDSDTNFNMSNENIDKKVADLPFFSNWDIFDSSSKKRMIQSLDFREWECFLNNNLRILSSDNFSNSITMEEKNNPVQLNFDFFFSKSINDLYDNVNGATALSYFDDDTCIKFIILMLQISEYGKVLVFKEICLEQGIDPNLESSIVDLNSEAIYHRSLSTYLNLINIARYIDNKGKKWKFSIQNSFYDNTTVTIRVRKVLAFDDIEVYSERQLKNMYFSVLENCLNDENYMYDKIFKYFADKIFRNECKKILDSYYNIQDGNDKKYIMCHFIFNSENNLWYERISPFYIQKGIFPVVWIHEENINHFVRNTKQMAITQNFDIMMTYSNESLSKFFDRVFLWEAKLLSFMSINYLSNDNIDGLKAFKKVSIQCSKILLLESYKNNKERRMKLNKLFMKYEIENVKTNILINMKKLKYRKKISKEIASKKWMLIKISI
uniref:Ras-GEF domain-containing protein n=1 Tax=Parastrongyloides trichosuri TaxID=131310 RepID=A0A0N4ZEA4_PARTI